MAVPDTQRTQVAHSGVLHSSMWHVSAESNFKEMSSAFLAELDLRTLQPLGRFVWRPFDYICLGDSVAMAQRDCGQGQASGQIRMSFAGDGCRSCPAPSPNFNAKLQATSGMSIPGCGWKRFLSVPKTLKPFCIANIRCHSGHQECQKARVDVGYRRPVVFHSVSPARQSGSKLLTGAMSALCLFCAELLGDRSTYERKTLCCFGLHSAPILFKTNP